MKTQDAYGTHPHSILEDFAVPNQEQTDKNGIKYIPLWKWLTKKQ
jgi:hypothetical protein